MIELLSPVGDFECLKAAVQSGADSVYLGGSIFNARASASNFDNENLKKAIRYAKLRNVKINFVLNTLIKDNEFEDAINLAKYVYTLGADAIIVQDLGLAKYIINNLPGIDVHASTQMTIHNLQGVLELERLGFKRVVLSRELGLSEIEYIASNCNTEIEAFVHGALCISYSGQCLFSSTIGARSGNRGKCAQPCRLPYKLTDEKSNILDDGYILSPRDLCSLQYIPELIKAGVKCFKIEGRMKTPEYVSVVTSIYRKYINLALSDKEYIIDNKDIQRLMQVFNRGGFSTGNLESTENLKYVYNKKPNNMGLYIGNVSSFNKEKGLITFTTNTQLNIGDKVSFENESHKYTVTELMIKNKNITIANAKDIITIGRIKGNISLGDQIYKLSSKSLTKEITDYYNNENIKIPLEATINIHKGYPISLIVKSLDTNNYSSIIVKKEIDIIPTTAISSPLTKDRILAQLTKTNNTQFEFKKININLEDNTYLPKISAINQLRRDCLEELEKIAIHNFERALPSNFKDFTLQNKNINTNYQISLLLNELNLDFDYSKLENVDKLYIPLKYFLNKTYKDIIYLLSSKYNLYIYLPTIIKENYRNIIYNNLDNYIEQFNIKGIVISNISKLYSLRKYINKIELIGNYTLNVFNSHTINELKENNINSITLSPELDKQTLINLISSSSLPTEILVYGKLPIMTIGYCLLGKSNKCYPTCDSKCKNNAKYYLKDRLGYNFRILVDNMQTITTLYNSKITSIPFKELAPNIARISIIDENIDEINNIINTIKNGDNFTGQDYTNGNLNKFI